MDRALRHPQEPAEFGLAPAERCARHAHGRSHEQTIALLTIAVAADRDLIRVRFGESPLHRSLSKTDAAVSDTILTKGIPQAAGTAWELHKDMIACAAVMLTQSWIEVVLHAQ